MAKTALIMKSLAPAKFSTRRYSRCRLCGRPRGYLRNHSAKSLMERILRSDDRR